MNSVKVFLPVLKGKISFTVDKGRHWSIVEHLLLDALSKRSWSTSDLAIHGDLPRRVVIEALVRLMRAGWVELDINETKVNFRATEIGKIAVTHSELPKIPDLRKRPTNYILDAVCGEIFRNKDLTTQSEQEIYRTLDENQPSVWVKPLPWHNQIEVNEALQILLDPDETFVSGQPGGIYRRWVTVVVRNGRIVSGLPETRPLDKLRKVVLDAAEGAGSNSNVTIDLSEMQEYDKAQQPKAVTHNIDFSLKDLVLGGEAHHQVLLKLLESARTTVFIHSTFISASRVLNLLPEFKKAIDRGVYIHIFWGQTEDLDERASSRSAISDLRKNAEVQELVEHLIFHPFSTNSHSKLVLADADPTGGYVAAVGSCNWLTSGFSSYEASVVLRDPKLVDEVVRCFGRLVCMHDGLWSELAGDIVRISQSLRSARNSKTVGTGSIIVGAQHNELVLKARDEAKSFILLTSHRLGMAAGPGILTPLQSAATDNSQLAVNVFYCRKTAPIKGSDERRLTQEATSLGVSLTPIQSPRIHAKLLIWDDDNAVITSLNWLSADQTSGRNLEEIGVHLRAPGVGRYIYEHLNSEIYPAKTT